MKLIVALSIVCSLTLSCSQNALLESAKRDTDAARLFEARKLMNQSRWDEAITAILAMSTTAQANRETKAALASAYAGKCGLNLITLADSIANAGSAAIFPILLTTFRAASASSVTSCQQAETTLLSIATEAASRTANENTLLAFVDFAKIGAILALYADTNDDASADVGFDSCQTAQLPDAMLREIGTGLTIATASLSATGTTIGTSISSAVTSACATLAGINPTYDFCSITDPTLFTVSQVKAIGGVVKSTDSPGVGTCAGSVSACVCP